MQNTNKIFAEYQQCEIYGGDGQDEMKQMWFVLLNCDAHEIMMIVISVDGIGFGFKCACLALNTYF